MIRYHEEWKFDDSIDLSLHTKDTLHLKNGTIFDDRKDMTLLQ